ncbi:tryptophan-rich sensory protein [Salibacterium salarium]|uniref:Tryptophan-rich sensory protein n=1 Tax=Salibacterium salarium TaxID=284579 RepID=A0A3R9PJA8_9BACI|nr:tryptophan-rich sensory protein [Salibacterium salarium]RSL31997.1 tryptophan-rich sensory protein [Salibacterium salarium]
MIRITIVNITFFLVMIVVNYSAATNVGIVANEEPLLIQPAGYAFSIWGLIYVLLFLWILRAPFQRHDKAGIYRDTQVWIPVNFLLNSVWIITFTNEYILLSTFIIFLLLFSLIRIYQIIYWKYNEASFARLPFSIYIGWVSAASVVNLFTWFVWEDRFPFLRMGELGWTILALLVLVVAAIICTRVNRDIWYSIVFIWVYTAIFVKNEDPAILWFTVVAILLLGINLLLQGIFLGNERRRKGMQ